MGGVTMTSKYENIYANIRNIISAEDICKTFGLNIKHGRCACPFHNGKDMNMQVYPGNRGFYCFVCHKGGDCISLARGLLSEEQYTYNAAARWIDKEFNLNLFGSKIPSIWERDAHCRKGKRKNAI